ncbi:MAG: hypothetical protein RIM33_14700 [Alphaproteobacteria bacterium]
MRITQSDISWALVLALAVCTVLGGCSTARVVIDGTERLVSGDIADGLLTVAGAPVALINDIENNPFNENEDGENMFERIGSSLGLSGGDDDNAPTDQYADSGGDPYDLPSDRVELASLYDPNAAHGTAQAASYSDATYADPYSVSGGISQDRSVQARLAAMRAGTLDSTQENPLSAAPAPDILSACNGILRDALGTDGPLPASVADYYYSVCIPSCLGDEPDPVTPDYGYFEQCYRL